MIAVVTRQGRPSDVQIGVDSGPGQREKRCRIAALVSAAAIGTQQFDRCFAASHAELLYQQANVPAHRHRGDAEPIGDFAGRKPFAEHLPDLPFASRERHRPAWQRETAFRVATELIDEIWHKRPRDGGLTTVRGSETRGEPVAADSFQEVAGSAAHERIDDIVRAVRPAQDDDQRLR